MGLITWQLSFKRRLLTLRRWVAVALGTRRIMKARTRVVFAVLIFALAFAIRSLHAVDLAPQMYTIEQPLTGLIETYDLRALSILRGDGLLGPYYEPEQTTWLAQAPGYSIYLSAMYRVVGRNFFNVQLIQNAMTSLAPVLIFLIAGQVLSWRVGAVSGLLAALSHGLAHISNFVLPDSLAALPILAASYCLTLAHGSRQRSYLFYSLSGVLMGIASWLRPQSMLLGIFVACVLWLTSRKRRSSLIRIALLASISILMIAPITLRNYRVYDAFVPINIGIGIVLWEGIADASGNSFGTVSKDEEVAAQEAITYNLPSYADSCFTPDGIVRDRIRTVRSLAIIRQHPVWYAGVMLGRCGNMLNYSESAPLVRSVSQSAEGRPRSALKSGWEEMGSDQSSLIVGESFFWMRRFVPRLQQTAEYGIHGLILIGALILFAASWRRALFISIVPLYYFLFQSAMHTEFRYTLPIHYFLFVFAAVAWVLMGAGVLTVIKSIDLRKLTDADPPETKRS